MKSYYGLIGAGGHGREVMPMLHAKLEEKIKKGDIEVFFVVEDKGNEDQVNGYKLIDLDYFLSLRGNKYFNIAIGDSMARQRISQICLENNIKPFSIIARSAVILDNSEVAEGYMISEQTIITSNVIIGRFFQANCQCNISHDCKIGDYVTFAPGVKCNGNVHIGNHVYIGAGALIKQGHKNKPLTIGDGAIIGMGAVVIKDVPPNTTVVGNPAREIKNS